jgi:Ser/Thr protein kinase RdoA (MazF antagonist)
MPAIMPDDDTGLAFDDYSDRYHAAHQTPEAVLGRMVVRATGSALTAKTRLTGASNEVYLVTTASGQECLLKISLFPEEDFEQERWAMDQCRAAGAPVPEVLAVGEEEGREFIVQTKAPGRPLDTVLPGLGEAERARLRPQIGAALAAIHSVAAGGFWKRLSDGSWDFPDWVSVMNSCLRDRAAERPFLVQAGFGERDVDEMIRLLTRYRDEFDCPQPVLCHADYIGEHIFVTDDLRVSAIVDFGDFCGDHPIHDLTIVAADEMDLDAVLRGYGAEWVRGEDFADRLHLHRLALEMGYLAHFLRDWPGHPAIPFHVQALRSMLAWLSDHGW